MARARAAAIARAEYWPGFVDVLTNLLLVFIFLLSIFALVQFLLSREISGKDTVLDRLNAQIAELTEMLALEKAGNARPRPTTLDHAAGEPRRRQASATGCRACSTARPTPPIAAGDRVAALDQRTRRREAGQPAGARPGRTAQPADLGAPPPDRRARRRRSTPRRIARQGEPDPDRRSRPPAERRAGPARPGAVALPLRLLRPAARDPRRPARHPGRRRPLRLPVGGAVRHRLRPDQRRTAQVELDKLAEAISELTTEIPPTSPGCCASTATPTSGRSPAPPAASARTGTCRRRAPSRSCSTSIDKGIPPDHLVAAGFGEFQPLEEGDSEEALAKNRRIELKLTEQ